MNETDLWADASPLRINKQSKNDYGNYSGDMKKYFSNVKGHIRCC